MVKLEEVDEDTYPEQPNTYNPDDEEGWDTDSASDISDLSDEDAALTTPNETLLDRLTALKDMLPPNQRRTLASLSSQSYNWGAWGVGSGLKVAWQVSTSVLLLVVPFSLVMMEDQAIMAEEQQNRMREMGSEMMTQGSEGQQQGEGQAQGQGQS